MSSVTSINSVPPPRLHQVMCQRSRLTDFINFADSMYFIQKYLQLLANY